MKIIIFLFLFILIGCQSEYKKYLYDGDIKCPKISSPKGADELILKTENNIEVYTGLRGVNKKCYLDDNIIKVELDITVRVIRKVSSTEDELSFKLILKSIDVDNNKFDSDYEELSIFLKEGNNVVEVENSLSVDSVINGEVLIGLTK